jgi:hypothetical protein
MSDPHTPANGPYNTQPTRMPHPEVYMDYIAEGLGARAWRYHVSLNRTDRLTIRRR